MSHDLHSSGHSNGHFIGHFIGRYTRHTLYAAWIITLLTLSACSGERRLPPPTAAPPIVLIPATTSQPTPTPPPTAVATTVATPVEQSAPATSSIPYNLPEVGIALDYPDTWHVIDVSPEIRAQSSLYAIEFNAEQPEEGAQQSVPENETKFDLVIQKSEATSAEEAATQRKEELAQDATGATVLAESTLTLPSGLEVVRLELEGRFGPALEFITAVNGHMVIISGLGNFKLIEAIANTLRLSE